MLHDDPLARGRGPATTVSQREAPIDGVEQLDDQHAWRQLHVGLGILPGVGDDQPLPGGEQRLEEQRAVVLALIPVASMWMARSPGA